MYRLLCLLLFLIGFVFVSGCYVDDSSSSSSSRSSDEAAEEESAGDGAENEDEPLADEQREWDSIRWRTAQGPSGKGAKRVMTLDGQITSDGRFVRFSWDRYPWSGNSLGHFFVWDISLSGTAPDGSAASLNGSHRRARG